MRSVTRIVVLCIFIVVAAGAVSLPVAADNSLAPYERSGLVDDDGRVEMLAEPGEAIKDRAICWPVIGGLAAGLLIIIVILVAGRYRKNRNR